MDNPIFLDHCIAFQFDRIFESRQWKAFKRRKLLVFFARSYFRSTVCRNASTTEIFDCLTTISINNKLAEQIKIKPKKVHTTFSFLAGNFLIIAKLSQALGHILESVKLRIISILWISSNFYNESSFGLAILYTFWLALPNFSDFWDLGNGKLKKRRLFWKAKLNLYLNLTVPVPDSKWVGRCLEMDHKLIDSFSGFDAVKGWNASFTTTYY